MGASLNKPMFSLVEVIWEVVDEPTL